MLCADGSNLHALITLRNCSLKWNDRLTCSCRPRSCFLKSREAHLGIGSDVLLDEVKSFSKLVFPFSCPAAFLFCDRSNKYTSFKSKQLQMGMGTSYFILIFSLSTYNLKHLRPDFDRNVKRIMLPNTGFCAANMTEWLFSLVYSCLMSLNFF